MTTFIPALIFTLNVVVVAMLSWVSLCAVTKGRGGLVETSLGWLLLALEWIVGAGVLLGLAGWLNRSGFLFLHTAGLIALICFRRSWKAEGQALVRFLSDWGQLLRSKTIEGRATLGLILAMLFLAVLAAQANPAVFDALTYRLSRIGQWLQDGRIANYQTDDPRINYMPVGPDLVIAWLLGATNEGFRLAPLSQLLGGLLLLGATFGLSRVAGLGRPAALGAVALVLGMANVAVQFTTLQSDLFTAGVFSTSYLLWHRALVRNEGSWIGGIGIALAWASKGTMFYLAPGAALWVGWLGWRHRASWRALLPTAAGAMAAALLLVGPSYYRNVASYGSFFGPREAVLLHHGGPLSVTEHVEKMWVNLETSSVQLFDPTTQPFWCREVLRSSGRQFLPRLSSQDDRYLFLHDFARRFLAEGILEQVEPDADILSCGIMSVLFFFTGLAIAFSRRTVHGHAAQILVWGAGILLYVLVQHAFVQWHQWAFRFFVLAAPWVGVVGAWGICQMARRFQLAIWVIVLVSSAQVFFVVQWRTPQAAWQAVTKPGFSMPQFVYSHWHEWAASFDQPLRLALPINNPLAGFYRTFPLLPVSMEKFSALPGNTAEAAVKPDGQWLVVPAIAYMDREGKVMGTTWLMNGEAISIHSLAAFRALQPGETPWPMLYRSVHSLIADGIKRRLLVRSWQPQVKLRLQNFSQQAWRFEVGSAGGYVREGMLAPVSELTVQVPISGQAVGEIVIDFHSDGSSADGGLYPAATLIRP